MIKHYFKTAWRNLIKNRLTAIISVVGLSLGVMCFFLLATYIINELRYDRFHKNAARIVFASMYYKSPSDAEAIRTPNTPTALAQVAKREIPGVENATRVYNWGKRNIRYRDKLFSEKDILMADQSFFDIFTFTFLEGNPHTALKEPHSFVITKSAARKYFGSESAMGKIVRIDTVAWQITGVVEDVPSYSTIQFNIIGSYNSLNRSKTEIWNSANDATYLLLQSPGRLTQVKHGINNYLRKTFPEEYQPGNDFGFDLEPLVKEHLYSKAGATGNVKYLYIFSCIAVLLLVIACINFTNLVTAKSIERSKEIGVRKVFGAARKNIFFQFMSESAVITIISLGIGILLALLLFPVFNGIVGLQLNLGIWNASFFTGILLMLFLTITFLSGIWPSVIISKFKPVLALKNIKSAEGSSGLLRKLLVIFQFTASIAFIMATLVARKQLYFIQHTDTGIDRSQIVVLDGSEIYANQMEGIKEALLKYSSIKNVSSTYDSPVNVGGGYTLSVEGKNANNALSVTAIPVDKDYINTLGIKIVSGGNFNYTDELKVKDTAEDKRVYSFMINETALKALGLNKEEAIGKKVGLNGRTGRIKAVLKDFNFASLRQSIQPLVVFLEYDWFGEFLIKTSGGDNRRAIADIQTVWKSYFPNKPFEYHFLDDDYNALYKTEQRTASLLDIFSLITIFISCLGLFGLITFVSIQRTKEIGVRKVMGASVLNIVLLLTKDFLKLILIAFVIASPIAWLCMHKWLQDFAFRIDIKWWLFVMVGFGIMIVTIITISWQAMRAAGANPIKSLKAE